MSAVHIIKSLKALADPNRATTNASFFKDHHIVDEKFLGIRMGDIRSVVKGSEVSTHDILDLLESNIHEVKMAGVLGLVTLYEKAPTLSEKKKIVSLYVSIIKKLTNWDYIDASTPYILGMYVMQTSDPSLIKKLIRSKNHWERRAAMVANWMLLRKSKDDSYVYDFAQQVLEDDQDLMHKATGWMLREAGKVNQKKLEKFLDAHVKDMPRVMVRYAIEKFDEKKRKKYLAM